MAKEIMTMEQALQHTGALINAKVESAALKAIPHYIWMESKKAPIDNTGWDFGQAQRNKDQFGKCTSCNQWMNLDNREQLPDWVLHDCYVECEDEDFHKKVNGTHGHKDYGYCPCCGAQIQYRSLMYKRMSLRDRLLLIVYGKSKIEQDAVYMVGYEIDVEWGQMDEYDRIEPPLDIIPREICVFRYGKSADRFIADQLYFATETRRDENGSIYVTKIERLIDSFIHRKECKSGFVIGQNMYSGAIQTALDKESFNNAIHDSSFERVWSEEIDRELYIDRISAMAAIAKYPCLEYMLKLGLTNLVEDIVAGGMGNLLNLRGKTAQAVLKVTSDEWGEIKGHHINVNRKCLEVRKWMQKYKIRINIAGCMHFSGRWYRNERMTNIFDRYPNINKQGIVKYSRKYNIETNQMADYIKQMITLEMDINDKSLLFPRDFDEAHGRLSARIGYMEDEKANKAISEMQSKLNEYRFSAYGLVLRPFESSGEVINEGTALHHCVGSYVKRYENGSIVLCALRDETALNKPLYTVEFGKDGRRIQCRGYSNKDWAGYGERVKAFWRVYDALRGELAQPKKQRRKSA